MFKVKKKENVFLKNIVRYKDTCIVGICFVFISCMIYIASTNQKLDAENINVNSNIYTENEVLEEKEKVTLNYLCLNLETNKIEEIGYKVPLKDYMLSPELVFVKEYINLNIDNKIVSPFSEKMEVENVFLEHGKLVIDMKTSNEKRFSNDITKKIQAINKEKRMNAIYKTFMNIKEVEEITFKVNGKVESNIIK